MTYDPKNAHVFFIDAAGAQRRETMIARNKPSELNVQIPATLAAGAYTAELALEMLY